MADVLTVKLKEIREVIDTLNDCISKISSEARRQEIRKLVTELKIFEQSLLIRPSFSSVGQNVSSSFTPPSVTSSFAPPAVTSSFGDTAL